MTVAFSFGKLGGLRFMNCKKYRACLVGVIAVALICGVLIYMKHGKENEIPTDGILVERDMDCGDETEAWA